MTIGRLDLVGSRPDESVAHKALSDVTFEQAGLTLYEAQEALEKRLILKTLDRHHWHRTKTAAALGIPRRSLQRKMKKYGII
jgi:DNA-binding NtrC family response regulator